MNSKVPWDIFLGDYKPLATYDADLTRDAPAWRNTLCALRSQSYPRPIYLSEEFLLDRGKGVEFFQPIAFSPFIEFDLTGRGRQLDQEWVGMVDAYRDIYIDAKKWKTTVYPEGIPIRIRSMARERRQATVHAVSRQFLRDGSRFHGVLGFSHPDVWLSYGGP